MRSLSLAESEAGFQSAVLELARLTGWLAYHTYDSRHSAAGFPDLVLVRPGDAVLFVELKTVKGKTSAAQRHWLALLSQVERAETYLWRPGDFDAIERRLQRKGK